MRAQLAGLGATSIKWRCKSRVARVPIGQPVWVRTVANTGSESYDVFPGIACTDLGTRMLVCIEAGAIGEQNGHKFEPNSSGFCKIPLSRIDVREGELVAMCQRCGNPVFKCQCEAPR